MQHSVLQAAFFCVINLAGLSLCASAEENLHALLAGTYHGEVYNGSDLDPVVTTFIVQPSGRVIGEYEVSDEQGVYSGRISNIVFESAHTIELEWTDKFGEGFAVMEFSRDFNSFSGQWSPKDGGSALPWNGKR